MSDARERRDLAAAATVHATREAVVRALGPLAARPLDERAARQMRRALARATSAEVRAALRHLETSRPRRTGLRVVAAEDTASCGSGATEDPRPLVAVQDGAA